MTDTDTSAEAVDRLRFQAFKTNLPEDRQAYFDAASKWFQDRHIRAMDRDDTLRAELATARNAALNACIDIAIEHCPNIPHDGPVNEIQGAEYATAGLIIQDIRALKTTKGDSEDG